MKNLAQGRLNGKVHNVDGFAKSRHSRLSGIVSPHNRLKKKDSGQAGMTDSG